MAANKQLMIERPNEPEEYYPWPNKEMAKKCGLDRDDIERLESGEIVWKGDTAYCVEDEGSWHD